MNLDALGLKRLSTCFYHQCVLCSESYLRYLTQVPMLGILHSREEKQVQKVHEPL